MFVRHKKLQKYPDISLWIFSFRQKVWFIKKYIEEPASVRFSFPSLSAASTEVQDGLVL